MKEKFFPDIGHVVVGERTHGKVNPFDNIFGNVPGVSSCIAHWDNSRLLDFLKQIKSDSIYVVGGLPNPLAIAFQFGLTDKPFNEITLKDIQKAIESGNLAFPYYYDYPQALQRAIETSDHRNFLDIYGISLDNYLDIPISKMRDIKSDQQKHISGLDWELHVVGDGKDKVLSRGTWQSYYPFSSGFASLSIGSTDYEGKRITQIVGERGNATAAANLLLIYITRGKDELKNQVKYVMDIIGSGNETKDKSGEQLYDSIIDMGSKLDKQLGKIGNNVDGIALAGCCVIVDRVPRKIDTYSDFNGKDLQVKVNGKWYSIENILRV